MRKNGRGRRKSGSVSEVRGALKEGVGFYFRNRAGTNEKGQWGERAGKHIGRKSNGTEGLSNQKNSKHEGKE